MVRPIPLMKSRTATQSQSALAEGVDLYFI
jgi:hypothetical protein